MWSPTPWARPFVGEPVKSRDPVYLFDVADDVDDMDEILPEVATCGR